MSGSRDGKIDFGELVAELPALVPLRRAAEFLDASERTVRRWILNGEIRGVKTSKGRGGRLLIPRPAIQRFLEEKAT